MVGCFLVMPLLGGYVVGLVRHLLSVKLVGWMVVCAFVSLFLCGLCVCLWCCFDGRFVSLRLIFSLYGLD